MLSVFDVLNKIAGAYAIVLIIVGTLTSFLSLFICIKLYKVNTFLFLSFLIVSDIISLYFWLLNKFTMEFLNFDVQNYNLWHCKLGSYFQFSSLQISGWILVLISFDQYLSVKIKNWRTIFKTHRAFASVMCLVLFFLALNSNIVVLYGYELKQNGTVSVFCFAVNQFATTKWMRTWGEIHLILYSVVPFGLILVLNSLLILKMRSRSLIYIKSFSLSNSSSRKSKRNSMNKTVIILTFLFILMTLPSACASYFFDQLFVSEHGRFIVALCDAISFSYHGLNFVVYFLTNRRFRRKLMNVSKSLSV